MKYLFILKSYPRLSDVFIAQEIHLLEQQGFDITILSTKKSTETQLQPINELVKAPVIYTPEYILPELKLFLAVIIKSLYKSPGKVTKLLLQSLFKSLRQRGYSPFKRLLQALWTIEELNLYNNSFDYIHSHYAHIPTEIALNISKLTNIKFSISAHAKDIYTIEDSDLAERIHASEFITTCTNFNKNFILNLDKKFSKKVFLNYHGLNTDQFKAVPWTFENTDPLCFVSVGRLVGKKGYPIIFKALSQLKKDGLNIQYDIFGDGELEEQLRKLAKDLNIEGNITFKLTATHPEIIDFISKKPCVFICGSIITSNGDRDGIPNTVAEAMSMEVPVVASEVSGIPEIIDDGVNGLLVKSGDPQDLAKKLRLAFDQPELTQKIAKNARQKVLTMFESKKLIHPLAKLIKNFSEQ